jgi:hypothetical protein
MGQSAISCTDRKPPGSCRGAPSDSFQSRAFICFSLCFFSFIFRRRASFFSLGPRMALSSKKPIFSCFQSRAFSLCCFSFISRRRASFFSSGPRMALSFNKSIFSFLPALPPRLRCVFRCVLGWPTRLYGPLAFKLRYRNCRYLS